MLKVIWRIFLHLLDKNFGRNFKYHKIFNRNNVKISYSCMDNIRNIISSRKKGITHFYNEIHGKTCNCRNKSNWPLDNKCKKLLKLTNKLSIKLKLKPKMASKSYLGKLILVSARENLSSSTTTIQYHLETGHTKMIPNFQNSSGI